MKRYKYTNPDVVHMRKVRRNGAIAAFAAWAGLTVAAYMYGKWAGLRPNNFTLDIPDDEK